MILMRLQIYIEFFEKIIFYYLIDLCHILNWFNSEPKKIINF